MGYLKSAVGSGWMNSQSVDDISVAGAPESLIPVQWDNAVVDELVNRNQLENHRQDAARTWRDEQINASQWLLDRDRDEIAAGMSLTLTTEDFYELIEYRQELRDWPQRSGFPKKTSKPLPPDWLMKMLQGV